MPRRRAPRLGSDLALLSCAAGWGLTFPLVRGAVGSISPVLFVGLRFALATAVLTPLILRRAARPTSRAWRDGLLVGLLSSVGFASQTIGLTTLPSARAAFLTSFYVLLTPALAWTVTRRRVSKAVAVGAALAFLGGLIYTGAGGPGAGRGIGAGDLWTLLGALAFSAQMVALSVVARRHGSSLLAWLQCGVVAVVALAASPFVETPEWKPTGESLFALAFTSIVGSALLLGLQAWGQRRASAPRTAVLLSSEPLWAALCAWLFWAELLGGRELVGGAFILAGILVAELVPARARRGSAEAGARRGGR